MHKNVKHMILTDLTHQNMEPALNFMTPIKFSNISSLTLGTRTILKDLEAVFLVFLVIEMAKKHQALGEWVGSVMTISSEDLGAVDLGPMGSVHLHHHHHLEVECLA